MAISSNQFTYPTPADDTFSLFNCLMYANCGEQRPRATAGAFGCVIRHPGVPENQLDRWSWFLTFSNAVLQRPTRRAKSLPKSPPPTTSMACFRVRGLRTLAISPVPTFCNSGVSLAIHSHHDLVFPIYMRANARLQGSCCYRSSALLRDLCQHYQRQLLSHRRCTTTLEVHDILAALTFKACPVVWGLAGLPPPPRR